MTSQTPELLVQPTQLAAELAEDDGSPLVLDVRYNLMGPDGHQEYREGHVPGAVWVDLDAELAGAPGSGGRHPLPEPDVFVAAMRRVGLTNGTPVVVCDGGSLLGASRLWWLLCDHGHPDVRVLDGGFAAWRDAGLPLESGEAPVRATGDFVGEPGHLPRVDVAEVAAGERPLLDVRAPERFTGESEPVDPVAGHVPGAVNVPAAGSFRDGRFRPAAELAEHFATVPSGAAVYCGSGVTATQTLLAMAIAGRTDAVLYPGSWSEWITDPDRPVATGD